MTRARVSVTLALVTMLVAAARSASPGAAATTTIVPTVPVRHLFWANVEGASHTARGGNDPGRASGAVRMRTIVAEINATHADAGVLVEFEASQARAFRALTHNAFGLVYSGHDTRNSIFYRRSSYRLVQRLSLRVPYFNGHMWRLPIARLRDRVSGALVRIMALHNAANTAREGNQSRWRHEDVDREVAYADRHPRANLVLAGDFNDRSPGIAARTDLRDAAAGHRSEIDKAFGRSPIRWVSYRRLTSAAITRATDHRAVYVAGFREPATFHRASTERASTAYNSSLVGAEEPSSGLTHISARLVPHANGYCGASSVGEFWVGLDSDTAGFAQLGLSVAPGSHGAWYELFTATGYQEPVAVPFSYRLGQSVGLSLRWNAAHTILRMEWVNYSTSSAVARTFHRAKRWYGGHYAEWMGERVGKPLVHFGTWTLRQARYGGPRWARSVGTSATRYQMVDAHGRRVATGSVPARGQVRLHWQRCS